MTKYDVCIVQVLDIRHPVELLDDPDPSASVIFRVVPGTQGFAGPNISLTGYDVMYRYWISGIQRNYSMIRILALLLYLV